MREGVIKVIRFECFELKVGLKLDWRAVGVVDPCVYVCLCSVCKADFARFLCGLE